MIDFTNVIDIMLGQNQVTQIEDSLGNVLWSATPTPPVPTPSYFYVEDVSGAANTLSIISNNASSPAIEVFSSTDQTNWTSMGTTSTTPITATVPANGKLYLKATTNTWCGNGTSPYNHITCSGDFNAGGYLMSLLAGDNFENATIGEYTYTFRRLFYQSNVISAANLVLPSNVRSYTYSGFFQNCTKLTTAPATLPATTLDTYCYYYMFDGCTALTTPPTLPATVLANYCYNYMFSGCTGLTTAPALPATTLADFCYNYMFSGCTGLTTAPALPTTTLAGNCYNRMFSGCTGLTTAPTLPATILVGSCYTRMFEGCTSLTTAPALPAMTLAKSCYQYMFSGCTSLTTAPALPATTLFAACYKNMFNNCTSLTTAPVLPARVLVWESANGCYQEMFNGCTNLNSVTTYADDIPSINCLTKWLNNVAATGDFYNLGSATYTSGVDGIPTGWTEHTQLP